ncbi:MAG: hypothetical protein HY908_01840 [Myxococcales bacterium]|nr:hypothetical protein [Myxococcales bacterium]
MAFRSGVRRAVALALAAAASATVVEARAIDIEDVGVEGETLTLDFENSSEWGYRFDNRNDVGDRITPGTVVDDRYGEWLNRFYFQALYWRFALRVRVDSAVYLDPFDRQDAQDLIVERTGEPDLLLENRFGRELHSRYQSLAYPAKLSLSYTQPELEATLGDFYAQLGRGLVFSVRKIDELGLDTTVRGLKLSTDHDVDGFKIGAMAFAGQMNPMRIDWPTGRILHGTSSPFFFAFPRAGDFHYYATPTDAEPVAELAKPSYLEDNAFGAHLEMGSKEVMVGANGAILLRTSNSAAQLDCRQSGADTSQGCAATYPSFTTPSTIAAHDQIRNFSLSVRVPPIENVFDAYVEVAGQHQTDGRVASVDADGEPVDREAELFGYALYANLNFTGGPVTATLEGKHYRSFFPLKANVDSASPAFGAPEFGVVAYSQPPTTESQYVEPIGSPDVCNSGGRGKVDVRASDHAKVYGWLGHYASFSEIDANNAECATDRSLRSDTWEMAAGTELNFDGGSHAWAWIGARLTDRAEAAIPSSQQRDPTAVFYREGYVRYDLNAKVWGPISLSALGFHRRRFEPTSLAEPWNEGEDYVSLNWSPEWGNLAFTFGHEYQTRPGLPELYFSGGIQYRSKNHDEVVNQIFDTVRMFVGQRRAAIRCVAGTCRLYPAYEGAKLEIVSRF